MNNLINIKDNAINKIAELMNEEENLNLYLRAFVQGGGCSGFQYGFTFDEVKNEDDFEISQYSKTFETKVNILIDSASLQYLSGSTIEYIEDLNGAQFNINNPNAQTTCGCGSSFSV